MAPWNKEPGPLGKAQKEGDVLKKRVDQVVKEATKLVNNKKAADRDEKLKQMYSNCIETKSLVQKHYDSVQNLKEEDETNKIKDYEKKKTAEMNRLSVMVTQLTEMMNKLLPDTSEAEFLKQLHPEEHAGKGKTEKVKSSIKKDDDDDDDEEEEEEEEEDATEEEEEETEEEDNEEENTKQKKSFPPVQEHKDEDEEDEEDEDEEESEDEKVDEKKAKQKKAATVKQEKKKAKDEDDENEDDEDEDEEDDDEEDEEEEDEEEDESAAKQKKKTKAKRKEKDKLEVTQSVHQFVAFDEYEGEEEGDLAFEKGDILTVLDTREDGWWLAQNEKGEKGLVPSTFLKVYSPYKGVQQDDAENDSEEEEEEEEEDEEEDEKSETAESPRRSGRELWRGIRKAVNETTVSDVLHAMGAVPSGFRPSTLCRKFNEGDTYRMANYLTPKLSQSNLTYRDLFFDPATNRIRPRSTRVELLITLVSCRQIPPPGAGIDVLDRHVRICLFDGQHILSNIHSVKVASVDKSQRTWTFSTRVHDLMNPHLHGEVFARTNNTSDNIGILFELSISYMRTSTQERGEFSCGWVHLPLLENGMVVTEKSYDLYVHGGTPYEKGVEVDPSISRQTTSNALVSLISGNKQPRLQLKVHIPRLIHKDLMDTLPDILVGNTCLLRLYSFYRQSLVDTLLRDRLDLDSTELIHDPVLREFPRAADVPDLMEYFTHEWIRKLREVKRDERLLAPNPLKDEEYLKELFRKVFLESVYAVSHVAMLPEYRMGDVENGKLRSEGVARFAEAKLAGKSTLAALLSADLAYKPFEMDEVAYSIIGPYSLSRQPVAAES